MVFGWTGEHVAAIAADDDGVQHLMTLTERLRNGEVPEGIREFFVAGKLVLIKKGTTVRPIGIPNTFYRLAGITAAAEVNGAAAKYFPPIQFGVGVRGGAEIIVHLTEALLLAPATEDDSKWSGEPLAGFLFDAENAFNSLHRSAMLTELFKRAEFKPIWKFAHWAYSRPSLMLAPGMDGKIQFGVWSYNGVRQGDPLGPLLFGIAIHPILVATEKDSGAKLFAFLDDITPIGTPQQVCDAIKQLDSELAFIGLRMSRSKSVLVWFHESDPPAELQQLASELALQIECDAVKMLGCPIGRNRARVAQMLLAQVDKHRQFFEALQNRAMSAQIAMLLLRFCGTPKLNYLCRTATGEEMKGPATQFHQMMMAVFLDRANIGLGEATDVGNVLIHQPLCNGGVGIPDVQSVRPLAWLGSFAAAAETTLSDPRFSIRVCGSAQVQKEVATTVAEVQELQTYLRNSGAKAEAAVPSGGSVMQSLELYGKPRGLDPEGRQQQPAAFHLQHLLTIDLHEGQRLNMAPSLTDVQRETLSNFGRPHASAWMLARADEPQTTLSDLEFSHAMRSRLMFRPVRSAHQFAKCPAPCNADISNDASNHSLGCSGLKASWTIRHNMVAEPISRIFRMAGCVTKWVPLTGFGQYRGDLLVIPSGRGEYGGAPLMLDFTFSHTLCGTRVHQHRYHNSVNHTLKSLEAAKTKVYQQHGAEPGWTFYPMAGTTFGAIGGQAMECLQLLPKLVPDKDKDYGEKLYRKAFVWWSVALQRGNSMVQLNGVYRGNVANRQELGQDQPRRRPDR